MEVEIDPQAPAQTATPNHLNQARQHDQETIAWVAGESVKQLPTDLYIPPEALEVFLDTFEGPLDLLLYLIRRQNLNILDVKVAVITAQYMEYIDLMQALELELAGEYLLMAAMLAEIKSRMLLPRPEAEDEEDDPRAELIRRLQEYEQIKTGAERLDDLPRVERELFIAAANKPELVRQHADPDVDFREVLLAMAHVLRRAEMFTEHEIQLEPLSVRERMGNILNRVKLSSDFVPFQELFAAAEGRLGVVVTFLAVMELVRESLLEFQQAEAFAPIHVRAGTGAVQGGPLADFAAIDAQYSGQDTATEENRP
ncbi:MAG: segregation/condensation protein A [Gammaproteobacteria bacterium]|jgi:segregation and condensation protein A|nr:segregation/condensation protein A [Gammaproteobacteria bacterium]|tara:strand:- start:947 stop:1885 length:939 start_codon:yes stop_codon:yes gene_type:complete